MKILLTGSSSGIGLAIKQAMQDKYQLDCPTRGQLDLNAYPEWNVCQYDVMILCAGSDLGGKKLFVDMQDSQWQNTMQVNFLSNIKLMKDYVKSRHGLWSKIVVFGSTVTDHVWPKMLPYTLSKIALEKFCQGFRQEIDCNIGIVVVRPGLVKTNFNMARHQGMISQAESDQWYESMPHLQPEALVPVIDTVLQDRVHSIREITVSL